MVIIEESDYIVIDILHQCFSHNSHNGRTNDHHLTISINSFYQLGLSAITIDITAFIIGSILLAGM